MKWLLIKIWSNLWLYKYVIQKITVRRSTNCSPQLNEHVCLSNSIQNNYLIYQFKRYQLLVRNLIEHIWDCYLRIEKYVIFIWCTKTPALGDISFFFFVFFFKFLLNEKESLRFLYDERYDRVKVEYSSIRSYPPQKKTNLKKLYVYVLTYEGVTICQL